MSCTKLLLVGFALLLIGAALMLVPIGRFLECQVISSCYEPTPLETLVRPGWYYFKAALGITLAGVAVFSTGVVQRHRKSLPDRTRNNVAQD